MAFIQPLNLENLFVTTFAGTTVIFTFLFIVFLSALSATFRMPKIVYGAMLAVAGVIFAPYLGGGYLLLILVSGIVIFGAIANQFR